MSHTSKDADPPADTADEDAYTADEIAYDDWKRGQYAAAGGPRGSIWTHGIIGAGPARPRDDETEGER